MQPMQGSTWRSQRVGVALGVLALCGVSAADTICVPDDYGTIQQAIDAAFDGDEICVAPGTYNETINFIGKAVRLYSTDGPEVTVIDGRGAGTVVRCVSGEGSDTVLQGFKITGGYPEQPTNCTFTENGGGMFNWQSSPTVTDCTFQGNLGNEGGGILNRDSDPTIRDCTFRDNTGWRAGGMSNQLSSSPTVTNCTFIANFALESGGGMDNRDSNPTVTNCTFIGNEAQTGGGGMSNDNSSPIVIACTFHANSCDYGGGIQNWNSSDPTVTGCTFTGNAANDDGGGMYNGAGSNPRVTNCTFVGNTASLAGGGMMANSDSNPTVTNCTFIENGAYRGGGMANWDIGSLTVTNSIVWNNTGGQIDGPADVSYSDVEGGYDGVGNIAADPVCDEDGRPQAGSPCIDAGANNAVPADLLDLDNDGDTIERIPIDLDGNRRFMDDGATEDTGCGLVVVDMGAYEFPGEPVHPVLIGDIDGDGTVGFDDLVHILSSWGPCDPECCLADVDFTWEVDFDDLLIVLDNWS